MFYKELTQLGENFEQSKRDLERGYPITLVQEILTEVKFSGRNEALRTKQNKQKRFYRLLIPTTGNTESQKDSHETLGHHSTATYKLKHIFNQPTIVFYRKEKSLKDILVSAKIPSISQQSQNQRSG